MADDNVLKFKGPQKVDSILDLNERFENLKTQEMAISEMAAKSILKALDAKDNYTFTHSVRVAYFSLLLGIELELDDKHLYELQLSALFHDIGKIGTPDAVLNKPTRLSDPEFRIMQKHPEASHEILIEFNAFENVALFARHHHERFDGRGYPDNLKGEEIPLASRIILIADTFDAMTSTRIYRKAFPYEVAYNELIEFSGTQFDPKLVESFIKKMRQEESKKEEEFYIPLFNKKFSKDAA